MSDLSTMSEVEISELMRGDYPQPRCPQCGRFARRGIYGTWVFDCLTYLGRWIHD